MSSYGYNFWARFFNYFFPGRYNFKIKGSSASSSYANPHGVHVRGSSSKPKGFTGGSGSKTRRGGKTVRKGNKK